MTQQDDPIADNAHWHHFLPRRLLWRLVAPVLVGLAMLGSVIFDLYRGQTPLAALLWLAPGLALGYPFGRMSKVVWDSAKSQVVGGGGQMAIMIIYVAIRFGSRALLSAGFGTLTYVGDIALLLTVGTLVGRSLGLLHQVRSVILTRDM